MINLKDLDHLDLIQRIKVVRKSQLESMKILTSFTGHRFGCMADCQYDGVCNCGFFDASNQYAEWTKKLFELIDNFNANF